MRVRTVRLVRRAPTNCTVPKQNSSSGNSECPRGPYSFLFRAYDFAVSVSHLARNELAPFIAACLADDDNRQYGGRLLSPRSPARGNYIL